MKLSKPKLLAEPVSDSSDESSDSDGDNFPLDEDDEQYLQGIVDLQLYTACATGDLNEAQNAVKRGAQFDADTSVVELIGHRALHIAAEAGQVELARYLLSKKAAADPTNEEGHTPLHLASYGGFLPVVQVSTQRHNCFQGCF